MDVEARGGGAALKDSCRAKVSYRTTLALAYQSFGVVYGDLSTSPLYVYKSTFSGKLKLREHDDEILGVLSFIFWTFMLVTLCKYIFFVLTADDNGEVLSAVQGIKVKADLDDRYIVLIACVILVGLFALQHFGTRKVGFLFAPIVIAWILCISSIGIYNIIRWNPTVFRAISPYYMFNFFRKTKVDGWESLGGIVLCITGAEAMFADLGHFSQLSIKIAFTGVVYPCLILTYMGDAAFLSKHKGDL